MYVEGHIFNVKVMFKSFMGRKRSQNIGVSVIHLLKTFSLCKHPNHRGQLLSWSHEINKSNKKRLHTAVHIYIYYMALLNTWL